MSQQLIYSWKCIFKHIFYDKDGLKQKMLINNIKQFTCSLNYNEYSHTKKCYIFVKSFFLFKNWSSKQIWSYFHLIIISLKPNPFFIFIVKFLVFHLRDKVILKAVFISSEWRWNEILIMTRARHELTTPSRSNRYTPTPKAQERLTGFIIPSRLYIRVLLFNKLRD